MRFSLCCRSELHPRVDPTLLGLNKGAGVEIKLRILTDALDGLRSVSRFPSSISPFFV